MRYRGLELDPFQEQAIGHLQEGRSVLVAAPTGTGKTIIADWIVDEALRTGKRAIYTAPIKALSNQKFRDYCRLYGEESVGLVTGDLVIRRQAPCLVMTTEILRNILLAGEGLDDLLAVIIDEVHFLDDRERGTVWEEVLIYLPPQVQVVALSATVANMQEFSDWLSHVRGHEVAIVQETHRAVPLHYHLVCRDTGITSMRRYEEAWRRRGRSEDAAVDRSRGRGRGRGRDRKERGPTRKTNHIECVRMARDEELLPSLYFVFSRHDTERFARALGRWLDRSLLDEDEQDRLEERLRAARITIGAALDPELEDLYRRGVAFHHAGVHVHIKALVEELYEERLVKVLYCTSTFALGINMPARSVIFDGLFKYDGRALSPLTTRGFMQKAGRAGRRGMDDEGHVLMRVDFAEYEEYKPIIERYRKGAYEPVHSRFSLSWNSVVNLLGQHDEERIRQIVDKSFLSWHLAEQAKQRLEVADRLEAEAEAGGDAEQRRQLKQARKLRRRAEEADGRCWSEFLDKVRFLQSIGYLSPEREFQAGARVLRHLQIAEIGVTELVLSGSLESLDAVTLFGVLVSLTNDLPRGAVTHYRLDRQDRSLLHQVGQIVHSDPVRRAGGLSGQETVWCPELFPAGRDWARGVSLEEILRHLDSRTDISGSLITGFRRAKDLAGQLRDVYADIPAQASMLADLVRSVSRDEVEVVD